MSHERRVIRNTIDIAHDGRRQTIAAGRVLAARTRRDYADEAIAAKVDLWIETEVLLPSDHPWPGEPKVPTPGGLTEVVLHATDTQVDEAEWLATAVDEKADLAWHIYRATPDRWAEEIDKRALVAIAAASEGRHRRTCGATPGTEPVMSDPTEAPYWRIVCGEEPGHDPSNYHTPHRATGLGSHGDGIFTWHEGRT